MFDKPRSTKLEIPFYTATADEQIVKALTKQQVFVNQLSAKRYRHYYELFKMLVEREQHADAAAIAEEAAFYSQILGILIYLQETGQEANMLAFLIATHFNDDSCLVSIRKDGTND